MLRDRAGSGVKSGYPDVPAGPKPPSQRQLRVAEEVRHRLVAAFARDEIRDPEIAGVVFTVTEVRMTPDLRHATAYVTRLGRDDVAEKLPALRRAAPVLRRAVAPGLRLRHAPELHFEAAPPVAPPARVEALLHSPEVARDLAVNPGTTAG